MDEQLTSESHEHEIMVDKNEESAHIDDANNSSDQQSIAEISGPPMSVESSVIKDDTNSLHSLENQSSSGVQSEIIIDDKNDNQIVDEKGKNQAEIESSSSSPVLENGAPDSSASQITPMTTSENETASVTISPSVSTSLTDTTTTTSSSTTITTTIPVSKNENTVTSNIEKLTSLCSRLMIKSPGEEQEGSSSEEPGSITDPKSSANSSSITATTITVGDDEMNTVTDLIIHLLTSEDLQRIHDRDCLASFFHQHLRSLPVKSVAEILSVLIAVLKKSLLNLEDAKGVLVDCIKYYCFKSPPSGSHNLIKHFLREVINLLSSYSCNVQELKCLLDSSQDDSRLLHIIREANRHQKGRPPAFFAFPGTKGSVLALPPLVKWPTQNGWTFISWFRLEPNSINSQPYLYFFRTSKSGIGYSAHFTGNCLVLTSMKIKNKGYQHCIPYEFVPFKWYHCAIVYVTKWRGSEIKVFVNGQMTANTEISWQVQTQDMFDKCFIGGTADLVSESYLFCGQLSAIYLFHEALNPSQICAIHRLGPAYMGQYRYPNEMGLFDNMPIMMKRVLYEEKLSSALVSLYTPVAVEGDTLCLQSAPKGNASYFVSSPHAALLGDTRAILTRSISDTLQSIGGIKALLPLLNRYTGAAGIPADPEACSTLIGFICDLLESSPLWFGNEVVQSHGFVIISSLLAKNPRSLINEETLEILLNLTKTLMSAMSTSLTSSSGDSILLKQLMDSILFNSSLWIYVDSKIQICLYCYLATEFLTVGAANASSTGTNCDNLASSISPPVINNPNSDRGSVESISGYSSGSGGVGSGNNCTVGSGSAIFSEVRRISTVLQLFHSLKYYYWLVPEDSNRPDGGHPNNMASSIGIYSITTHPVQVRARELNYRPSRNDLISIRSYILLFIKQLIIKGNGVHHDELQAILNYLSTVHQDVNLLDVLQMLQTLMIEHPSSMIPAFDMKHGVRTIFKLLDSSNEEIRIQSIKLLGYFLSRSTAKRKQDVMGPNNLFMLLRERLVRFTPLSIDTYDALFEILVETPIESVRSNTSATFGNLRIENPMVLKVIATLITDGNKVPTFGRVSGKPVSETINNRCDHQRIKKLFISDLWRLLVNNRENRRLVLQMSVWQHWLINLIENHNDHLVRDQILAIFRILLYHAIKYEFGGWRVWIDTLAIIHAKVSFDDFMNQFGEKRDKSVTSTSVKTPASVHDGLSETTSNTEKVSDEPTKLPDTVEHSGPEVVSSPTDTSEVADEEDSRPEDERELSTYTLGENKQESEAHLSSNIEDITHDDNKPDIDDEPSSVKMEEINEDCLTKKESDTIKSNDPLDLKSVESDVEIVKEEVKSDEEAAIPEAPISTISSTGNSNLTSKKPEEIKEQDELIGVTETDVAPSRIYRKAPHNSLKEFYTSLVNDDQAPRSGQSRFQTNRSSFTGSATPAFRIPEFRWSSLHLKLLNDLFYSIECDLQMWKSQSSKDAMSANSGKEGENKSGVILTVSPSQLDQILQHPDNQIYIVNAIHLFSQLCDNIIIASGGLLPLLAAATGGNSSTSGANSNQNESTTAGCEGLSLAQANSLLFRLVNMADLLCFAATHINFADLESEKNMSAGGILRQCLRLVCTVAVKNCLAVQKHSGGEYEAFDPSKDVYNIGTPMSVAAELFGDYGNNLDGSANHNSEGILSDVAAGMNLEYVSGNYSPLQPYPIKDASKLLQEMDVNRLRACIYRDTEADAKQSQFLALATLYFISVLMVSEYRDIIESKSSHGKDQSKRKVREEAVDEDIGTSGLPEIRSIDSEIGISSSNIGNILTSKLEQRLSSICPLLREIMCDFASFLSKTLLGSHGQDLVSKEAVRTFRRPNASPVELVMLLCSQEWQNTLQKNAGLAFIELINEGRLLSHAMKDHIVRVAMEAEFILNRLRADDVSKHEQFNIACLETLAARAHEELLINSLINSAKRRDRMIYIRFKEYLAQQQKRTETDREKLFYRLDTWEDDARRRRRFLLDPYGEENSIQFFENPPKGKRKAEKQQDKESGPSLPAHLIIPKQQQTSNNRDGSDDENDLFLWESEDLSSSLNGDIDERPPSAAEFAGTVLYSVDCNLIWNIYAIEGTLQITANELFFEATNINENVTVDGSIISKGSGDSKSKSRPSSGSSGKDNRSTDESLKGLAGSSGCKLGKGGFRDLDLKVLRYCDLLTYNGKIPFMEVRAIFSRRYLLQPIALEIFLAQRTSVMFVFSDSETVKKVVKYLPPVGVGVKYGIPQSRRASLMTPKQLFASSNMTQKWQKREISNFEYLMFLNTIAGRTYQDLNQYPVFPWILTNYDSDELDLSQPTNFRDLSKPVGALNSERRAEFVERYNSWDNSHVPAFHYGTHYSTAAFTLGWIVRLEPFHSAYLALQDGRVEDESRLFTSIRDAWLGSLMGGQQNVKELIPELFYLPEILTGTEPESVRRLYTVELPKWAKSPEHFIRLHRMALESDLVSCQLHQWIDLIFGYKQRGPEAIRAVNVFYYLTYEGNVDLSQISCNDPNLREAIEAQIRHFGQTPSQLTTEPHPPRSSALHVSPLMFSPVMDEVCMSIKFPFNAAVVNIAACALHNSSASTAANTPSSIVTINGAQNYHIHKWTPKEANQPFILDPALTNTGSSSSTPNRRHILDTTSLCSMSSSSAAFSPRHIVTIDSKHIIMAPFYDNSFRVFSTETGKLTQVIYGHRGLVTCLTRSECNMAADFYVASGSVDCSVLFWTWNAKYAQIEGNNGASAISGNPLPKLILTGHESMILSLLISAELGLIISGSKNLILIHSMTNGDCISVIDVRKKHNSQIIRSTIKSGDIEADTHKIKATLEASMSGESAASSQPQTQLKESSDPSKSSQTDENQMDRNQVHEDVDYLICNLLLARELAFIVGTAVPTARKDKKSKKSSSTTLSHEAPALLFTHNLRGDLHKHINFPKPKDLSSLLMTITRDGEYLIISESPFMIKIYRTFDITPLYALNTNDLLTTSPSSELSSRDSVHGANAVKSLLLIDHKYLLVGTENGRLIIYKLDFNRWHHEYSSRY